MRVHVSRRDHYSPPPLPPGRRKLICAAVREYRREAASVTTTTTLSAPYRWKESHHNSRRLFCTSPPPRRPLSPGTVVVTRDIWRRSIIVRRRQRGYVRFVVSRVSRLCRHGACRTLYQRFPNCAHPYIPTAPRRTAHAKIKQFFVFLQFINIIIIFF